jgi:hypothetical protein
VPNYQKIEVLSIHRGAAQVSGWVRSMNQMLSASSQESVRLHQAGRYYALIRENLDDFINVVFPISQTLVDSAVWRGWLQAFAVSSCRTSPLFRDISGAFIELLTKDAALGISPALLELMRWEHLEMQVDISSVSVSGHGVLARQLNPTLHIESFEYPVHRMAAQGKLLESEETVLLAWRTRDHHVKALSPDEVELHILLNLDELEEHSDAYHEAWAVLEATPALCIKVEQFRQKDILI